MPVLDNIFPAANQTAFHNGEVAVFPGAPGAKGEPFDKVMSQTLSARKTNAPPVHNRRQQTNFAGAQKPDSSDLKPSPAPAQVAEDSSTATMDLSVPVTTKAGTKKDDTGGEDEILPVQNPAGDVLDVSINAPIHLLAPTLAACLLNLFMPAATPKPTISNSAATVVLPAVAEVKNGKTPVATVPGVDITVKPTVAVAVSQLTSGGPQKTAAGENSDAGKTPAEKPRVKTAGVATVVPNISKPAGAGDSAPKKIETVPADDLPPDDYNPGNPVVAQNLVAESAGFAPAKSHGTSVAKQDVPMKNAEQTNKVAGPAGSGEKVLPGDAIPAARENNLPGRGSSIPVSTRAEPLAVNVATVSAAQDSTVRSTKPAEDAAAVSNLSDIRSQALDRTHDLMSLHALRLVGANSDSLQVVIKPDAGTQLSLELRQRGNGIEAQAVLQKGDFENLKQHWPELQQRLEQRGIKLAPLASDGNSATWSGSQGFKNQPQQSAEREPSRDGMITGFMPTGTMNNLPAEPVIQAASSRGFQTWA